MKSSKRGKRPDTRKLGPPSHLATLHQRLYHGLNLGFRYSKDKEKEWYTNDVEIQRLVVRSISSFLDGVSPETWQMPIVKDSIPDVVRAIVGILQSLNEVVLAMGSEVAVKLVSIVPTSMLRPHFSHLSHSLAPLLSNHQSQVAIMSATALKFIVSNLGAKKEKEVWEILEKHDTVTQVIGNLRDFSDKAGPIEHLLVMASLLSSVMQLWPHARYPVWNDAKLKEVMEIFCSKPDTTVKVAILHLYSALALCANGAQKLLENGDVLVQTVVQCMGESQPHSVRISAFKFAQYLMATKKLSSEMLDFSCEPIVRSIIRTLTVSSVHHGEFSNQEESLMLEATRLALITRWPGKHHDYFWMFRVEKVLLRLLMYNFNTLQPQQSWSVEDRIAVAREVLDANLLLDLRPFVWEIIGWLSAQREEDYSPHKYENDHCVSLLVTTACLAFVDSLGRERLLCQADRTYKFRSVSAAKATLMMMYSPCKYIASEARLVLLEAFRFDGEEYLKQLLHPLNFVYSGDNSVAPDKFQILISLIGLTCYSGLPHFYRRVVTNGGIKTLLTFIRWWLDNASHTDKVGSTSHLRVTSIERTCCRIDVEDWEGNEIHLLLALWSLAELINCHETEGHALDVFAGQKVYKKEQFLQDILDISVDTTSTGLRWYCSYLLSFFGFYGFPSKLGTRIASFRETDHGDMRLVLRDGQYLSVHQVILLSRCPSLLPPVGPSDEEKLSRSNDFPAREVTDKCKRTEKEVTLSAQVDQQALSTLFDYIYSGYLRAEGVIVKKLRMLAKHCNLQPLLQLLSRRRPKWAALMPAFDLSTTLRHVGHEFSDIILESESAESTGWTCSSCSFSLSHIHAHRVILSSSCDYMRALFQSGMQESCSQSLKVPVSWKALCKLVMWLYSNEVPKPVCGCLWANMDVKDKISELQPYIELCWLAEYWFLNDVHNECSKVITSSLDSPVLAIEVIQLAAKFSQWELVDIAANRIAPVYRNLHSSGALDVLDEALVELIRLAAVRLSQE
ncbi:BTB/POZ domain-containing protein At1g04390 isoform X1 [Spinacia oleracea]|uniref:BTB/POZ domain-containing protein At1g04390 isoform X1 n=1 Tax=Spinacia oleracea TaxID=3562 RepID=A0A9R0K3U0_SPIOL|nr:BTB/POZ domain-containing protein At1g04390 isoform X1 [Spinacia oleracea]